ncbi:MAG: BREX system P-loop protein BrxC [Clostridia bacterium]|nr:BREX system P-loop protein BrxC [Clostridia bacterium]
MTIKDLFFKSIERDIKGVIKVGQDDSANVNQELTEYVVTRELQKHFAEFFSSYKRGIHDTTDKMGVWITGFFGSGKSHFLKILSYLLSKKEVDGKQALDYFVEDDKIRDNMVLADMRLAASIPTDVVMFNIDSKGETTGKQAKDAIVLVFLKVFNEMQGFCGSNPFLADLERKLSEDGRYEAFTACFEENFGTPWLEARNDFDFIQDDVVDALSQIGFMSVEAARNWCEKSTGNYSISIERFAELVQRYIERKGNDHHVVFLVDEIGQYIGDDSRLMLDLQTLTEDLGTACQGKAWLIVTSQQDIDAVTKTKGNDFSKIQGRFDTRLSLSSANVDEVIRKRILEKTAVARETLTLLYDEKATFIKNLILFNDSAEKKLYSDRENFSAVYPFIPYQFNLLGSVLTSIRTHGASGKHLAEGERSMLALFKESAVAIKDEQPGALVPFHRFYDALEQFLDHSHKGVISRALDNEILNPGRKADCFDVDVLKALFLIKYVKEITSNVVGITSLMVSSVDDDRLALTQLVEDSLKRLERQTLIQKNGEVYIFLTNEEQEINRAIEQQTIDPSEITRAVGELIFEDLYDEKKYRYPAFGGRYAFAFNQFVDERPYKANQSYDISLRVLTPNSDEIADETTLRLMSGQKCSVLVVLPPDRAFLDEIGAAIRIEKFIRSDSQNSIGKFEQIKEAKKIEMRERSRNARLFLEESLKAATIYVSGDQVQSSSREIASRINDALGKLVSSVYHKLTYIDKAMGESDIRQLLKANASRIALGIGEASGNALALLDVNSYIKQNTERHTKTSMKTLLDRFTKAPYGFIEADVQWLVAKLFKDGEIALFVNNEGVTLLSKTEDEIVRFLTRKEYVEKLMTDKREKADEKQKRAVREVMKELFHVTSSVDDDDALMKGFMGYAASLKTELEKLEIRYNSQTSYPGKALITKGKALLSGALDIRYAGEFFNAVCAKRASFLDFAEDYAPLKAFFAGEQCQIFDKSLMLMKIYDDSKTFIVNAELDETVSQIKAILRMSEPYSQIYKLPELNQRFAKSYDAILDGLLEPAKAAIAEARKRVFDELSGKLCREKLSAGYIARFAELLDKAESSNSVAALQNIKIEADALKVRLLNEIAEKEAKLQPKPDDEGGDKENPLPPVKKHKTVSIKSINNAATWQIETKDDVTRYVTALETKLLETLEADTVINIEF